MAKNPHPARPGRNGTPAASQPSRSHAGRKSPPDWRPSYWNDEWEERCARLLLCGVCHELRGPAGPGRTQHCRCAPDPAPGEDQTGWARYDTRKVASLCRCCGVELLSAGSRWSAFYCPECRERAQRLNASAGRPVLPIGAHSIMNGIRTSGSDLLDDPVALHQLVRSVGNFVDRIHRFSDIEREAVRDRCTEAGLFGGRTTEIDLLDYLHAAAALNVDKQAAFDRLVERVTRQPYGRR